MFTKKRIALLILIAVLCVAVPIMSIALNARENVQAEQMQVITLWQIDGFEGGKGSRAQYLGNKAVKLFGNQKKYLNVITISAEAAEENIKMGKLPDMISCTPTFNAHLNYINNTNFVFKTWCYGSYCLMSLQENAEFSDISPSNIIVNEGKDNLSAVASALIGVGGAKSDVPTNAYLQLLNGKFKYMLGTQRDVFRLKTREVAFSVKKVSVFNDLYQNISILARDKSRYETCKRFVEYITENNSDIDKVGLFSKNGQKYCDELQFLQDNDVEYALNSPCGDRYLAELKSAAANNDVNKIKSLLK